MPIFFCAILSRPWVALVSAPSDILPLFYLSTSPSEDRRWTTRHRPTQPATFKEFLKRLDQGPGLCHGCDQRLKTSRVRRPYRHDSMFIFPFSKTAAHFHPFSLLLRLTAQAADASSVARARRLAASVNRRYRSAHWGPQTPRRAHSPSPCATTASPACWHLRNLRSPVVMLARRTYAEINRALLSAVTCAETHSSAARRSLFPLGCFILRSGLSH